MRTNLIVGLALILALAGGSSAVGRAAAAPQRAGGAGACPGTTQPARFSVQVSQGISVFSPKWLVVYGTCFAQGASITIWDYDASISLTNGWTFIPATATGRFSYTVANARCNHLMQVVVLDVAHNTRAAGNGKVYGPCQAPPPVFNSQRAPASFAPLR